MEGTIGPGNHARAAIVMTALFVLSLAFSSVATDVSGADEPEETVLRIGFLQDVDNLSPMLGLNDAAYVFCGLVYDCMHAIGNDFEVVGNIAVDSRLVPEGDPELAGRPYGSIWEYDITQNAMWHDGEPFTIDDFVWNMKLHSVNYDTMWAFQPYAYYIEDVKAVDADTARIYFFDRETGDPMPVSYAYLVCIPMLPTHLLSTMNVPFISFEWTGVFADSDPPIVGTGPFMATDEIYAEWLAGDHITLVRNPNYHWGPDKGLYIQFDKLVMYFYDDATAMSLALKVGNLDIAQFPPQTYNAIKTDVQDGDLDDIATYDGLKCTQYWTEIAINKNTAGHNQFRLDPVVRQALAMATNKSYIVNNHYLGLADEGSTLISPVNEKWHYEPTVDELYTFDLDLANQMLDDAGYRYPYDGADWREVTADSLAADEMWAMVGDKCELEMMIRREFPEERDIAAFLESQWALLGIDLEYEVMDEATLGTMAYSYGYDTMIWYWSADPDPNFMLFSQSIKAWNGWNDNMYTSDAYEENYSLSIMEFDEDQRKVYTDNAQRENYQDAYYIILAYPYQTYAWRTDTFSGWGDWENDPGRSMDNFWGGNPLYFDLEPLPDVEPPTTYASVSTADGDNDWHISSVEIHLIASDDAGVIDYTKYRIDGGAWQDYAAPVEVATSGIHIFQYYSADIAGNMEDVQTLEVKVDTTAPTLWIIQTDGIDIYSSTFTLGWYCQDTVSGVDLVEVSLDDSGYQGLDNFTTWTNDLDPTCTYLNLTEVEMGDHVFSVRVHDNAGLVSEASINLTVTSDEGPPTTYAVVSSADGDNGWHVSSAEIQLSASDDSSGMNYTMYRIDGGAWQDYTEPVEIAASGFHVFQYYSVDIAGNIEDVQTLEVKIDTAAPMLWTLTADGVDFDSSNATLAWSCTDLVSGICLVEVSLDDGEFQGLDNFTTWTTEFDPTCTYLSLTEAEAGDHHISVRVQDNAGLVSEVGLNFTITSSSRILGMTPLAIGIIAAAIAGGVAATAVFVMLRPTKRGPPPSS